LHKKLLNFHSKKSFTQNVGEIDNKKSQDVENQIYWHYYRIVVENLTENVIFVCGFLSMQTLLVQKGLRPYQLGPLKRSNERSFVLERKS
jgi:hypothetical protein